MGYHEAGHAIVGLNVPQHDPIHKATIIPRGRALGLVLSLPERDQLSVTRTKYKSKIAMAMGGKVAEEMVFGPENVTDKEIKKKKKKKKKKGKEKKKKKKKKKS